MSERPRASERAKRTLVIVPAFNEADTIGDVIDEVRSALPHAEILVVDDGSGDSTAAQAASRGAMIARLPYNLGVGGAMRVGFKYAARRGYDVAIQVDGDGQHDPNVLPRMMQALDSVDIVIGARFAGEGDYVAKGVRRLAVNVLARVASRVAHTRLTDATSGLRATNRRGIALFAEDYPVEYLGDTVESLVVAARSGLRVRQVPVAMRPRAGGAPSQNPLRATAYLGRAALALSVALMRRRRPLPPEKS